MKPEMVVVGTPTHSPPRHIVNVDGRDLKSGKVCRSLYIVTNFYEAWPKRAQSVDAFN